MAKKISISAIVTLIFTAIAYYLILPPINIFSPLCWLFVGGVLILFEAEIFRGVNNLLEYESVTLLFGPIMGGITAIVAGLIALGSIEVFNK